MIKQDIDDDIKAAMLSGDRTLVDTLRTVKSVILDAEVNQGKREAGLDENTVISLLQKEAKKRNEAAELYANAGDAERAEKEMQEAAVIQKYLPEMMSEDEIEAFVSEVLSNVPEPTMQQMGQVIGQVKSRAGVAADGSVIAKIVKQQLEKL